MTARSDVDFPLHPEVAPVGLERVHLSVETRSDADMRAFGSHGYAAHPTTRALFVTYAFDFGHPYVWEAADLDYPFPEGLRQALADPFVKLNFWWSEFGMAILTRTLGLDVPENRKIISTATIAVEMGLPRKLVNCVAAAHEWVGFRTGDVDTEEYVQRFSVGAEDRRRRWPASWRNFKLASVCKVSAERAIYRRFMPAS